MLGEAVMPATRSDLEDRADGSDVLTTFVFYRIVLVIVCGIDQPTRTPRTGGVASLAPLECLLLLS